MQQTVIGSAKAMYQVIGQPKPVEILRHSLETGRLAHSYLFVGPPHIGKKTLALGLAQALNCEEPEGPCGRCGSCIRIAAGKHADVQVIGRLGEAAQGDAGARKEIGIKQIRELQQAAMLQPYEGRARVFIIDSAEHLNEESANCLLKTLEEPPPQVFIILLTLNDGMLLPTIVSRCQRVELVPASPQVIEDALVQKWEVAPARARTLSRLCRGCIGWAILATLDERVLEERSEKLAQLRGLATSDITQRFDLANRLAVGLSKRRDSVEETLSLWLEWWRDLLLVKAGCSQYITNVDEEAFLQQQAEEYELADVRDCIEAIRAAQRQLEQNANPRLVLEVLMLRIPQLDQEKDKALGRQDRSR